MSPGAVAHAPAAVEPLEGRQLMSATPPTAPGTNMCNVIITSVTQPAPAGVAILSPVYY